MKFKVGDKVRITREGLAKQAEHSSIKSFEISGWEIKQIIGDKIYCPNNEYRYEEKYLEFVLEEPEFEYGEIIEVSNDNEHWLRRMFIAKSHSGNYIGIDCSDKSGFVNGRNYMVGFYKYARKLRPQLTRKEIAEKFGVIEDFTLVD